MSNKNEQLAVATLLQNELKKLRCTFYHPPIKPTLAEHEASESHARRKGQEEKASLTVSAMIF